MPLPHSPCIPVTTHPMAGIHITDIESAINYWRDKKPSPDGFSLEPEIRALAEVYALMIFYHEVEADEFSFPRRRWRPGWPGTKPRPTPRASPSAPPARATRCARAADARLPRCSTGPRCARWKNARPGGASRWMAPPGGSINTPSGQPRSSQSRYKKNSCLRILNKVWRPKKASKRELFPAQWLNVHRARTVTQHQHAFLNRGL